MPRRRRLGDPLASPKRIERLLEELVRELGPQLSTYLDLEGVKNGNFEPVIQLLQAASNFLRSRESEKSTSKNSRFPSSLLMRVIDVMGRIIARESQGRISFRTFADNNLRVLGCPEDIKKFLEQGRITLFEALQLKRMSAETLAISPQEAETIRRGILARSREEHWIAHQLRHEIDRMLGKKTAAGSVESVAKSVFEPEEPRHLSEQFSFSLPPADSLLSQHLSLMIELLQVLDTSEIEKGELERLLNSIDEVLLQLQRIKRKQNRPCDERKPALGFA